MDKVFYVTTPIYYVNGKPHIGHAYTTILCDTFARYHRFRGEKVFFLTGTDEHGGKIEKTARGEGKEPQAYVDAIVSSFKDLWRDLDITQDDFIRTTEERHQRVVSGILENLLRKGDIYRGKYKGWHCVPCEAVWKDSELAEGNCPDCKRGVQELEEENFFFKLSTHQDWLVSFIQSHPDFIFPEARRNEILAFLENPLEDLCISRPKTRLAWGIPFPGEPDHVVYVWFDALINYVSAIGFGESPDFGRFWPADIQFLAKDILRQHTVYWPIMLRAMGLEPPRRVLSHGWWTIEGTKISKSRGNRVDPVEIITKYGVDPFRYFLLREVTIGSDGTYSEELLQGRLRNDLGNDLGNLVHRSFGMLGKYFGEKIPPVQDSSKIQNGLKAEGVSLFGKVESAMAGLDVRLALEEIWNFVRRANRFVEETKPWVLAKDPSRAGELAEMMYTLMESLRVCGVILIPFLPRTGRKILRELCLTEEASCKDLERWGFLRSGEKVGKSEPLFPRIEAEDA